MPTYKHTRLKPCAASPDVRWIEHTPAQNGLDGLKLRGNSWETCEGRFKMDQFSILLWTILCNKSSMKSDLPGRRNLGSKSKRRKHLVTAGRDNNTSTLKANQRAQVLSLVRALPSSYAPVVVLDDVADRPDSRQVLIDALRTDVVQRLRRSGIPVGPCEVDGHLVKRQQTSDAVEERWR